MLMGSGTLHASGAHVSSVTPCLRGVGSQHGRTGTPGRARYGTILSELVSWPEKPLGEPSQYSAQVQVVVSPSEPGVQTKMSEPSPLTPLTLKLPSVVR